MLLIYLERFFHLLDMFKVVELEPDRPATVKSGGAERPLRLLQKDFARTIPKLKEWHLSIGQPAIFFKDLTRGTGIIFFDDFCQWAVTASLEFDEPELEPEPQNDYAAAAAEAAAELSRKMKREAELLKAKRDAAQKSFNTRVEAAVVARHTHTSAADLIGQADTDPDGLNELALFDADGDGMLDGGAEQEAARAAYREASKARRAKVAQALAEENKALEEERERMRLTADAGVTIEQQGFTKEQAAYRRHLAQKSRRMVHEEGKLLARQDLANQMRLRQISARVDDKWTGKSWPVYAWTTGQMIRGYAHMSGAWTLAPAGWRETDQVVL